MAGHSNGNGDGRPATNGRTPATRLTTGAAYADGSNPFRPSQVRIERGADIPGERIVRADACVIGTGAGGAVVAKELAEAGMSVVMLEEGDNHKTDGFTGRPREMTTKLYRDAAQVVTVGNTPIVLPLGRAVGGTTLINSGTCFRTPRAVLDLWNEEFGLEDLTEETLDPFFRRVEREFNVSQLPEEIAGNNNLVVKRGAEKLGWSGDFIYRNVKGCIGSGVCNFGCPTAAKQHTGITYVPKAWEAGATTYTGCEAKALLVENGRARGVVAKTAGGGRLRVEAETVIVAAGTIQTPLLLRRNGLGAGSGELGSNLAIHPATGVRAFFDEIIDMHQGVPQGYYIDQFTDERVMLEGAAGPPDYAAMSFPFAGERHRALMLKFRHMSQFGLMVSELSRGFVRERGGRVEIRYDVNREDVKAVQRGVELLCEVYFAAGAKEVYTPIAGLGAIGPDDVDLVRKADIRAADLTLMAFHPLGTARADARPGRGVVDANFKLNGVEGMYVADGSVVPSSLGVNPMITISALATRLAFHLTDQDPPDHEPYPTSIAQPRVEEAHAVAV